MCVFLRKKFFLLLAILLPGAARGQFWRSSDERLAHQHAVWEYKLPDFGASAYGRAVEILFKDFEQTTGKALSPAEKGRAGLKVYTNSGCGIPTPRHLTRAVIGALTRRGFARERLFIVDVREERLRECGYIPPLSRREEGNSFHGVPVYALDNGSCYDPAWHYESPLPSESPFASAPDIFGSADKPATSEGRKSLLCAPLLTEVDFWINLPAVLDHPAFGINGALANATLWNISNRGRFFVSPANAPVAIAEIAAIPEMASRWALTVVSLEAYQFIGGPVFNSYYTRAEPFLWMSANPVILDVLMAERLNQFRRRQGFREIEPAQLEYAAALGLGTRKASAVQWRRMLPSRVAR